MQLDETSDRRLSADVEFFCHRHHLSQFWVALQEWRQTVPWREEFDSEGVGLAFLPPVAVTDFVAAG